MEIPRTSNEHFSSLTLRMKRSPIVSYHHMQINTLVHINHCSELVTTNFLITTISPGYLQLQF